MGESRASARCTVTGQPCGSSAGGVSVVRPSTPTSSHRPSLAAISAWRAGWCLATASAVAAASAKGLTLSAEQCRELSPAVLAAQLKQESGFTPGLTSPAGAEGYAQFLPGTWASFGFPVDDQGVVTGAAGEGDPNDIGDAVMAQGRYNCSVADTLRPGIESGAITGDPVELMLAGYNAGPVAVQQFGGVYPYSETQNYVTTIDDSGSDYDRAR